MKSKNLVFDVCYYAIAVPAAFAIALFTPFSAMEASVIYWAIQNLQPGML